MFRHFLVLSILALLAVKCSAVEPVFRPVQMTHPSSPFYVAPVNSVPFPNPAQQAHHITDRTEIEQPQPDQQIEESDPAADSVLGRWDAAATIPFKSLVSFLAPRDPNEPTGSAVFANFDYLSWQLRRRDLDYAVSGSNSALAVGAGTIHNVEFGQDSGFRAMIGMRMDSGWRVGFGYTNFATSSHSETTAPAGGSLFSTRSHPKFNEEAITAEADATFDFHVFDLEARHSLDAGERARVDVFGSFRWGKINQLLALHYDGFDFDDGLIDNSVETRAFGLRMGVEGLWQSDGGLYIFGRGEGSLMYGKYTVDLLETDVEFGTRDTLVDIEDSYEQVIPAIAAAAGLGWVRNRVEVRVGYELNSWFNLGDRIVFLDDTHEALFSHSNHDLLMDGFFLRVTFEN